MATPYKTYHDFTTVTLHKIKRIVREHSHTYYRQKLYFILLATFTGPTRMFFKKKKKNVILFSMYFARKININSTFKYILNYTNYKYIKIIYSALKSKVKFRPMIIYLLLNNNNNYDLFIYLFC